MKFYLALFLARLGFFKHDRLGGNSPSWWPRARVHYLDGHFSNPMAIGNVVDYAKVFGGRVVPTEEK